MQKHFSLVRAPPIMRNSEAYQQRPSTDDIIAELIDAADLRHLLEVPATQN